MPVVPFAPQPPKGRALPKPIEFSAAEEPWVLMAAAQMHSEGRLIDKPAKATFDSRDRMIANPEHRDPNRLTSDRNEVDPDEISKYKANEKMWGIEDGK